MKDLWAFLLRFGDKIFALLLLLFSLGLFFSRNSFQRSVAFSSVNEVSGFVLKKSNDLTAFLNLKETANILNIENAKLNEEIFYLRERIKKMERDSNAISTSLFSSDSVDYKSQYRFIPASIIGNAIHKRDNFLTIDKGWAEGISADMGVISGTGLIGIIYKVSKNYSLVIPLQNEKLFLPGRLKHEGSLGVLKCDVKDDRFAILSDVPRYAQVQNGDTLITASSAIFPEGLLIGKIEGSPVETKDESNSFRVRLFANVNRLTNVWVIKNKKFNERYSLEKNDKR